MKYFKSAKENLNAYREGRLVRDNTGQIKKVADCSHFVSMLLNYTVDSKHDVYVLNGVGAFLNNIKLKLKSIEDLKKLTNKKTGINPYQNLLDLIDQGYKLTVNKPFPSRYGGIDIKNSVGVYCTNYIEIANAEKIKSNKSDINSLTI